MNTIENDIERYKTYMKFTQQLGSAPKNEKKMREILARHQEVVNALQSLYETMWHYQN